MSKEGYKNDSSKYNIALLHYNTKKKTIEISATPNQTLKSIKTNVSNNK